MREAREMADEIILLRAGCIEQKGSFSELNNKPKSSFVKEFWSWYEIIPYNAFARCPDIICKASYN